MATALMALTATSIAGDKLKTPKTVYLNPAFVQYGIGISSGTNLTYQQDDSVVLEYEVSESVAAISATSNGTLLAVTLKNFLGTEYRQPKAMLLNARMISSIAAAPNPEAGDNSYSTITYNRIGKVNEQYTAAQAAATIVPPVDESGTVPAESTLNNAETFTFRHT